MTLGSLYRLFNLEPWTFNKFYFGAVHLVMHTKRLSEHTSGCVKVIKKQKNELLEEENLTCE